MKFKSNKDVTMAPVNFEDIVNELDAVLNMELEQAVEHLDDLEILHANIEKYGITEPVMHLVGGTLESMSISIADKESCLEGLKEGLKEAGKRVWEMIVKIFTKIIEFITGDRAAMIIEHCDGLLSKPDIKIEATHAAAIGDLGGILTKTDVDRATNILRGWDDFAYIDKYLNGPNSIVKYGSGEEIVYDSNVEQDLKLPPLKVAMAFGSAHAILKCAKTEVSAAKRLERYSKTCLKAAEMFLDRAPLAFDPHYDKHNELKISAHATNKIVLLLFKDATNKLKVVYEIYKFDKKSNDESK